MTDSRKLNVLLEMRPALEGYAGIPQEVRLLFRGLDRIPGIEVAGLLQMSGRSLARGTSMVERSGLFGRPLTTDERFKRYSNVVISTGKPLKEPANARFVAYLRQRLTILNLILRQLFGADRIALSRFESAAFEDFTWRTLFAKTLPPADFQALAGRDHLICRIPWRALHQVGFGSLTYRRRARYPQLLTRGQDVMIGQTPYPGRVSPGTSLVIRYHDAIPLFMPHTIPEQALHQAQHYHALKGNVHNGAWFSCVSETTRADLIRAFPNAEPRAVTIHNMVSHSYFAVDGEKPVRIGDIIRSRLNEQSEWLPRFGSAADKTRFYDRHLPEKQPNYLLMVSTIEPRKNHLRLIAAWERLRSETDPTLKLVIVGTLGWANEDIRDQLAPWLERGEAFLLHKVPSDDLRRLYAHAAATICPSYGEGFDYSGAEAMASGGVVVASDIPVHREIYDDGALYFDPYSTAGLVAQLNRLLYSTEAQDVRQRLAHAGRAVAGRYTPENILPRWEAFLRRVADSD
ncbi:glycosyltransferase family 4 protein [Pacificimonas sp. ICDLI1SI03]